MIIIGTAGHIDHGKTTLVGKLTGIQTDRLKEEQERGISIELGFAYLDVPGGLRCGIVDVPGHERFVRQMIAGATGIDLVLLVIAADEGVMQQTREHLDICRLLGIRRGVVVLTKVDLVDAEWLELVESDVGDFVRGTFLEGAPILHFSAVRPEALPAFRAALDAIIRDVDATAVHRSGTEPLRLPVDRVFTMRGFGTVVTGTVSSGRLRIGDSVAILPAGERCKVRGIESHNQAVQEVGVGRRAAVNLQGVEKEAVSRGDVVTHAGVLAASRMVDVDLLLLPHVPHPVASQSKALIHVGTSQVTGTIILLDREELLPGETAPVQLRLDDHVVALGGDHAVIRGFELLESYGKTLGGGVIRHPVPRKHRRGQPEVLAALDALRSGDRRRMAEHTVLLAGHAGATVSEVQQVVALSAEDAGSVLAELGAEGVVHPYVQDGVARYVHHTPFDELLTRAMATLDDYHAKYAHRAGIPREELRSQVRADLPPKYFAELIGVLQGRGDLELVGQHLRRRGFTATLTPALDRLRGEVLARFTAAGLEPPSPSEVADALFAASGAGPEDVREMTDLLVAEGRLCRVQETLVFAAEHIATMEDKVLGYLRAHGEISTPQLKEITGTTRKYTVPLGEHLDAKKLTIRVGDVRKLRT